MPGRMSPPRQSHRLQLHEQVPVLLGKTCNTLTPFLSILAPGSIFGLSAPA